MHRNEAFSKIRRDLVRRNRFFGVNAVFDVFCQIRYRFIKSKNFFSHWIVTSYALENIREGYNLDELVSRECFPLALVVHILSVDVAYVA